MDRIDMRDAIGGLLLVFMGLAVALYAHSKYRVGELARMGPGLFPIGLGLCLALLGLIILGYAFRAKVQTLQPPPFEARSFVAVLASVAVFALLIERVGLLPTSVASVFIAAFAAREFHPVRALALGFSIAAISWLIFIVGLQMTVPVIRL